MPDEQTTQWAVEAGMNPMTNTGNVRFAQIARKIRSMKS
jgi:hypothetical protein